MENHAKMYAHLFGEITKAIEILQAAQQETEEMYISECKLTSPQSQKEKE